MYTEEELAGLTDEEREAIMSDDDVIEGEATDAEEQAELDLDSGGEQEEDEGDEGGEQKDTDTPEPEGEQEPEEQPEEDAPEPETKTAPLLNVEYPKDAQEKLDAISSEREKLTEDFDNGEITAIEFMNKERELLKRERLIEQQVFEAELAQKMERQRVHNEFQMTVDTWMSQHPEYQAGSLRYNLLDEQVRKVAASEQQLTGLQILNKAHKIVSESIAKEFGVAPQAKPKPIKGIPPTLADLPSAEIEDVDGGRYAHLDKLANTNPLKFEAELAKMSEAERLRYLSE